MYSNILQNGKSFLKVVQNGKVLWEKESDTVLLPEGYVECEYLQNSDKKDATCTFDYYNINTNIKWSYATRIEANIVYVKDNARMIFFTAGRETSPNIRSIDHNLSAGSIDQYSGKYDDGILDVSFSNNTDKNIYYSGWTDTVWTTIYRIMYLKIYHDEDIIFNGIPCLDPSGRPCMYDTVTQQPFYNQGTGEFIYKVKEN